VARPAPFYRQAIQIDDPIDNLTEAIMSDTATTTTTLRYGYQPSSAFAATRAGAARRARETVAAATSTSPQPGKAPSLPLRLTAFVATLAGRRP